MAATSHIIMVTPQIKSNKTTKKGNSPSSANSLFREFPFANVNCG